jgi:hypothetical protein
MAQYSVAGRTRGRSGFGTAPPDRRGAILNGQAGLAVVKTPFASIERQPVTLGSTPGRESAPQWKQTPHIIPNRRLPSANPRLGRLRGQVACRR